MTGVKKTNKSYDEQKEWIVPCNLKYYDLSGA